MSLGLVGVLAAGACSRDDGAAVRNAGGGDAGGSVNVVGGATESGGSVSAVAAGCVTRGATTRLPTGKVEVGLDEWSVAVPPPPIAPGVKEVLVKNFGSQDHELWVVPAASPSALPLAGGRVVTAGLTPVVRFEAFPRNKFCENNFDIPAGTYVAFCNLAPAGQTPHFAQGMVAVFTVG